MVASIVAAMATCGQVKHIRHKSKHKAKIHRNVSPPTPAPRIVYASPWYQYGRDTAIPSPSPTEKPKQIPKPVIKLPPGFDEAPK